MEAVGRCCDVLIGATATAAEYAGVAQAGHISTRLQRWCISMRRFLLWDCLLVYGKANAPVYLVDLLLANVCKQNVTRFHTNRPVG